MVYGDIVTDTICIQPILVFALRPLYLYPQQFLNTTISKHDKGESLILFNTVIQLISCSFEVFETPCRKLSILPIQHKLQASDNKG